MYHATHVNDLARMLCQGGTGVWLWEQLIFSGIHRYSIYTHVTRKKVVRG